MGELLEVALTGLVEAADRRNGRRFRIVVGVAAGLAIIGISIWAITQMI